jgi:hypothetical protein
VIATLRKWYTEFKGFPEETSAQAMLEIQVKTREGRIAFSRVVTGHSGQQLKVVAGNFAGALRSRPNAKVVLEGALINAISILFRDQGSNTRCWGT